MSNDQQRERRIQDLIRLNNKKFKEERELQEEKAWRDKASEKQGRYKLKEYAKHIQEVNMKRIKAAKDKELDKEREVRRKQQQKAERRRRLEQDKKLRGDKQKQQLIKARRRRNSLQIEEINKKVTEMASRELRRIHSGKQLLQTQKELKKTKLEQLEVKRRDILAKTRKAPSCPESAKENLTNNVAPKRLVLENSGRIAKDEEEILNPIAKDRVKQSQKNVKQPKKGNHYGSIQEIQEQQCQQSQQSWSEGQGQQKQQGQQEGQSLCELDDYQEKQVPCPYQASQRLEFQSAFQKHDREYIARMLNTQSDDQLESSVFPGLNQDLFTLTSAQLLTKVYIQI